MPESAKRKNPFFKKLSFLVVLGIIAQAISACNLTGVSKPAALQVTSTPEATVFLDGKHLGKTPYYSDQIQPGEYTLKISASETSFVEKIDLISGTLTVVNRDLADNFMAQSGENLWLEPGKTGTLIVSSPSQANITIDGRFYGETPNLISNIEEGDHKVQLQKEGYLDHEFAIKTSSKYRLISDVALASTIAKGQISAQAPPPEIETKKVEVAKTPQGFLRVRKDASLSSDEIGRVNTGDQLEVIQETDEWVKVNFDGKQGWISKTYTKQIP